MLSYQGITEHLDKQPHFAEWLEEECLRAATEIGNTVKHCELRRPAKTKVINKARTDVIGIHINSSGKIQNIEESVPDYVVSLEDGKNYTSMISLEK